MLEVVDIRSASARSRRSRAARSRSSAGACSGSSGRTAPARQPRCARSRARPAGCGGGVGRTADRRRRVAVFGYMPEERGLYPAHAGGRVLRTPTWHGTENGVGRFARLGLEGRRRKGRGALARQPAARSARGSAGARTEPRPRRAFAGLDPLAVHTLAEILRGEAARGARSSSPATSSSWWRTSARRSRSSIAAASSPPATSMR